jgi:hypothetical protein
LLGEYEDSSGQGTGYPNLFSGTRSAALVQPLPKRSIPKKRPQGETEGKHKPTATCELHHVQIAVHVPLLMIVWHEPDDRVGDRVTGDPA